MRFQMLPRGSWPDFLDLPWSEPLAEWTSKEPQERIAVPLRKIEPLVRRDPRPRIDDEGIGHRSPRHAALGSIGRDDAKDDTALGHACMTDRAALDDFRAKNAKVGRNGGLRVPRRFSAGRGHRNQQRACSNQDP